MKNAKKSVLALLICLVLCFSLYPAALAEGEGEGGWYQGDISPADSALELWLEQHPLTPTEPFGDYDEPQPDWSSAQFIDGILYLQDAGGKLYRYTGRFGIGANYHYYKNGQEYNGWLYEDGGWSYFPVGGTHGGWYQIDGEMYYFTRDGRLIPDKVPDPQGKNGWVEEGSDASGTMRYYYFGGEPVMGWVQIDGKRYYFNHEEVPFGVLETNTWVQDHYVGEDGAMVTSQWAEYRYFNGTAEENVRCYLDAQGNRVTGWQEIDGRRYYFNKYDAPVGGMYCGWLYDGGWYYLGSDGAMVTGWQQIGDKLYYFNRVDKPLGRMCTGWVNTDGHWYYMNRVDAPVGVRFNGWMYWDNAWYYFKPGAGYEGSGSAEDGAMATGWYDHANGRYYFGTDGRRASGLQLIDGKTYYLNEGGEHPGTLYTGWLYFSGAWHYFSAEQDGAMLKSVTADIGGTQRTFDEFGRLK